MTGTASVQRRKRILLGATLGTGLGLAVDSTLTVWMGWPILILVVTTLGLVFLAPLAGGIWLGIRAGRGDLLPAVPWFAVAAAALVGWPLAVAAPLGARMLELRAVARREIPRHPEAELLARHARPLGDDNAGPGIGLVFRVPRDSGEIVGFYEAELGRRGWREVEAVRHHYLGPGRWFSRGGALLSLGISPADSEGSGRVEATYYLSY